MSQIYATLGSVVSENRHSFMTCALDSYMGLASLRRVITWVLSRTRDHSFWYLSVIELLICCFFQKKVGWFWPWCVTYSYFFNMFQAMQCRSRPCSWKDNVFAGLCCVAACWVHDIDSRLITPDASMRRQLLQVRVPFQCRAQIILNLWISVRLSNLKCFNCLKLVESSLKLHGEHAHIGHWKQSRWV